MTTGQQWLARVVVVWLGLAVLSALIEPLLFGLEVRYQSPNQLETVALWLHNRALRWAPFLVIACVAAPHLACGAWLARRWLPFGRHASPATASFGSWVSVLLSSWAALLVIVWLFSRHGSFASLWALAVAAFIAGAWSA